MIELTAPAKVNLSFRILRKREDGFHEVETLMAPIGLADKIRLERVEGSGIHLECSDPTLPTGADNLVVKAAVAFFKKSGNPFGLRIELEKQVPHGAGLGGGSSDAASVLEGLNTLSGGCLNREELCEIAAELGSDVPFFLYRSPAICRGRGEKIEPVSGLISQPVLLIKPPFGVPTPWAYSRWSASLELPDVDYSPQAMPWGEMVNDLERPVFEKYLVLAEMKTWLRSQPGVRGALMSGSGSTMFAVLSPGMDITSLKANLEQRYGPNLFLCETTVMGAD